MLIEFLFLSIYLIFSFYWILPDLEHTTPTPLKSFKDPPKLSKGSKPAIHRLNLYWIYKPRLITLPSLSHLEFNPLILSPKTIQG
jgi:hypothetical protein